jgi:hypothetical protein
MDIKRIILLLMSQTAYCQVHSVSRSVFILSFIYDVCFLKIEMAAKKKAGAKSSKKVKAGAKAKTTR